MKSVLWVITLSFIYHVQCSQLPIENIISESKPVWHDPTPNLVKLALSLNLTRFVEGLQNTSIDRIINHEGPYTVFAPVNEAFDRLPEYTKYFDFSDIMKLHVARGDYLVGQFKNDFIIRSMLSKRDVRVNMYGDIVTANGKQLVDIDYKAHNGVLHIIDDVMTAVYDRYATAYRQLIPIKEMSTLVKILKATSMAKLLNRPGPFTLLAPTNEAFSKLPSTTVDYLLKNKTALTEVAKHHIVPGTYYSLGLKNGTLLKTILGSKLEVVVSNGKPVFNGATTEVPDFSVQNGLIHFTEEVLIPPTVKPTTLYP